MCYTWRVVISCSWPIDHLPLCPTLFSPCNYRIMIIHQVMYSTWRVVISCSWLLHPPPLCPTMFSTCKFKIMIRQEALLCSTWRIFISCSWPLALKVYYIVYITHYKSFAKMSTCKTRTPLRQLKHMLIISAICSLQLWFHKDDLIYSMQGHLLRLKIKYSDLNSWIWICGCQGVNSGRIWYKLVDHALITI